MRQHRGQRQAARFGNAAGHDLIQPCAGIRPFDQIFAKVLHLVDAHAFAHSHNLLARRLPRVGAFEGGLFVAGFAGQSVVVGHFQPILLAPDGVHLVEHFIHRRGAEGAGCGAFFVRIADREAHLVVFDHLGHGVTGRGPVAKARHVKAARIAFHLAVDHPLRQRQTHAATLAKARHHSAGRPIVAQARNRADQRVAIGGKGKRPVDHALNTRTFQHGNAAIGKVHRIFDLVELLVQQLVAKVPRCAVNRPRLARLFIKPDAHASTFLAQVELTTRIHHMGEFAASFQNVHDLGDIVGDDILVRHGQQRQINACHSPHFARPQATRVDQMFAGDRAFFRHHFPAVFGGIGFQHTVVQNNLCPAHARSFGIGMGCARRVKVAIQRVVKTAQDALGIDQPVGEFRDFFGRENFRIQPHIAVLGAFGFQLLKSRLVIGQRHAAHMVQAAGHACDRLKLFVQADRIALQRRHIGIAVDRMKPASGVPSGARG